MFKKNHLIRLLCLIFIHQMLLGFTQDHEIQLLKLKDVVPQLKSVSKKNYQKIIQYSVILDDYSNKNFSISEETRGYLNLHKFYTPRHLHEPLALPHMFKLLIRAIRHNNSQEINLLIAAISHHINDAVSWYKEPHIRYYKDYLISFRNNFFIQKDKKNNTDITIADRKIYQLSLENLYALASINPKIRKFTKNYKPKKLSETLEDALLRALHLPYEIRNIRNQKIHTIFESINSSIFEEKQNYSKALNAQFELATLGIAKTADIIHTAWLFAKKNITLKLTDPNFIIDLQKKQLNILNTQSHSHINPKGENPAYVILTEGEKFRETVFGDISKIYVSAIINYFKDKNLPYYVMDINELNAEKQLNLQEHKMLIIPALKYNKTSNIDFKKVDKKIAAFAKEAPIIWLGGFKRPYMLTKLNNALKYTKDDIDLTSTNILKQYTFTNTSYPSKSQNYHINKTFPKEFNLNGYLVGNNSYQNANKKNILTIKKKKLPFYSQTIALKIDNLLFSQLYPLFPNLYKEPLSTFYPFRWSTTSIKDFENYLQLLSQ